jgi:hypothetical protein
MNYLIFSLLFVAFAVSAECVIRDSDGKIRRSASVIRQFKASNPCPATGKIEKRCKGYVVDHIHPLCHCGDDKLYNLQWQTIADAKAKDKLEKAMCDELRRN